MFPTRVAVTWIDGSSASIRSYVLELARRSLAALHRKHRDEERAGRATATPSTTSTPRVRSRAGPGPGGNARAIRGPSARDEQHGSEHMSSRNAGHAGVISRQKLAAVDRSRAAP